MLNDIFQGFPDFDPRVHCPHRDNAVGGSVFETRLPIFLSVGEICIGRLFSNLCGRQGSRCCYKNDGKCREKEADFRLNHHAQSYRWLPESADAAFVESLAVTFAA